MVSNVPIRHRVAVAGLMFETNSFAPGVTTLADVDRGAVAGPDVLTAGGGLDSIAGAAQVARAAGVEVVPVSAAYALSGPTIAAGVYARLEDRILTGLAEVIDSVDAIFLSLHGAMVAEDHQDVEGDLLTAVRALVGPDLPISYSADLHAHFTARMAAATPMVAGYRTLPHVDIFETGQRAMRLLLAAFGGAAPVLGWRKIPMITSAEGQDTTVAPMSEVMARVAEIAAEQGVLEACVFATQPWLDVTELGWSTLVVTDGDAVLAQSRADELARMAWDRRVQIAAAPKVTLDEALAVVRHTAEHDPGRPVVVSDGADSVSGGATGDGAQILQGLLNAEPVPGPVMLIITDEHAAAELVTAGVGAVRTVTVGGTLATQFHAPVEVSGRISTVCDGRYLSKYPPAPADVGPTAVLVIDERIHLVVTSRPASQLDPQLYLRVGLDPAAATMVVAKSAGGYKAFYAPLAAACLDVDTTGPSDSRLERLPYIRPVRPLWPLDPDLAEPW